MLEELVYPLRRHHHAPLTILQVLLALVPSLAGLLDHIFNSVWMERVQHLEEEVAFREAIVIVGQVVLHVLPFVNLRVDVLDGQPGPVRNRLRWHLLLLEHLLLPVEDRLEEDQLALGCLR